MVTPYSSELLHEYSHKKVIDAFRQGEFDYVEAVQEVKEADFFRAVTEPKILERLAATYPSPRKKHDVPLWVYIVNDMLMRFHGVHRFHAIPYLIRRGSMTSIFGPEMGHKVVHPQTGDISLKCAGFNAKNNYDRQTPCDQDYVRKMARQTDEEALQDWYNQEVVKIFREEQGLDAEGIFIGDATYLFVPNNERYENSSLLWFDEHNHPVNIKDIPAAQRGKYQQRRCYKLVSLLHTNRAGSYFIYGGLAVAAGVKHESPILYQLVEDFVKAHGQGVMKRLILDRGFLDGEQIGHCKQAWGIDILIPAKKNMDIYADVVGLAEGGELKFENWIAPAKVKPVPLHRPESIRKREAARQATLAKRRAEKAIEPKSAAVRSEVAGVGEMRSWDSCPVPLTAIINREIKADGKHDYWVLLDTRAQTGKASRDEYLLRTRIEERHRQLKCFSDLESFSAQAFSLIVNQVVFVLLTYSLLQWYLLKTQREELNSRTCIRIFDLLEPTNTVILIYHKNYVARLTPLEHQELLLTLSKTASKKILAKTRHLRRGLHHQLDHARAP